MRQRGQLVQRGKETWLVRVFLGRDDRGRRRYLNFTIHGGKRIARQWMQEVLRKEEDRRMAETLEKAKA